jgi:hypothetical protein
MQSRLIRWVWSLSMAIHLSGVSLAVTGCGGGETAAPVAPTETPAAKAEDAQLNFMKTQQAGKK